MSSSHKLKSDTLRLNYPLELGENVQPVLLPDSQTVEAARTRTRPGYTPSWTWTSTPPTPALVKTGRVQLPTMSFSQPGADLTEM